MCELWSAVEHMSIVLRAAPLLEVCKNSRGTPYPGQTCAELGFNFCCKASATYRFRSQSDAMWYDEQANPTGQYPRCVDNEVPCPAPEIGSGGGGGGTTNPGSGGGCDGKPEGAYRCAKTGETTIEVCRGGTWTIAESCDCAVKVGDSRKPPYASTCKS